MPFEALETVTKANQPPTAVISYMRRTQAPRPGKPTKSNQDKKPSLTISIPTTICGTSKSETFELLIGTGTDKGKLRIRGAHKKTDGVKPSQMKHAFRFNFGYVPKLGEDIFDGERRPVKRISAEEFEVDVPASWFEESK